MAALVKRRGVGSRPRGRNGGVAMSRLAEAGQASPTMGLIG